VKKTSIGLKNIKKIVIIMKVVFLLVGVKIHQHVLMGKPGSEDGILLILLVIVKLYLNVHTMRNTCLMNGNIVQDGVHKLK